MIAVVVAVAGALIALIAPSATRAQNLPTNSKPGWRPRASSIPWPQDKPYPGVIRLEVDATNTAQAIFRVHEHIPVAHSGPLVLMYPEWIPGIHNAYDPVEKLAGLVVRGNGVVIPWVRDPIDMHAFHFQVPDGVTEVEANFQLLSPLQPSRGPVVMGRDILRLKWDSVTLYPAGCFLRDVLVSAAVTYPSGFTASSALPSRANGPVYAYETTDFETLVDSPTLAGRNHRAISLAPDVTLDVYADHADDLAATPEQIRLHAQLPVQALRLFGAKHYDQYHFLFALSDEVGPIGWEHHRSSEVGTDQAYFRQWDAHVADRGLLPHEYTHSWDGKFRQGEDSWTPNYDVPVRNSLLWVYEGQTQFWGYVLQTRSGLVSREDTLDEFGLMAASAAARTGRSWRDLADTTNAPQITHHGTGQWPDWQRADDYYDEGLLVWLDIDSLLREKSGGSKSLEDFARAFFGVRDGDFGVLTYSEKDIVSELNTLVPWDWAAYLRSRLTSHTSAPLEGLVRDGYELVFTDSPSKMFAQSEADRKVCDLTYSGGLVVSTAGVISTVMWDSAAFKAGLAPGMRIVAVGDRPFSTDEMKQAIAAAARNRVAVSLTLEAPNNVHRLELGWQAGLRYPHLRKTIQGESDLDRLLAPKA